MAKYRHVYSSFWSDMDVVAKFTPEDKFFMLYILTNPHTTQIGIYKIPKKVMAYEIGYSIESINLLIDRFENKHKIIKYNEDTMEIAIKNWGRYNLIKGGTPVECCVNKELKLVEDISLIKYVSDEVVNPRLRKMFMDYSKNNADDTYHDTSEEVENYISESENSSYFYKELADEKLEENNEEYRKQANSDDTYHVSGGEKIKNKKIKEKYKKENRAQEPSSDETSETPSQSDKTPYEEILLAFRSTCKSLPKVMARTKRRDKAMKSLYKDLGSLEKIQELFEMVEDSDFLTGRDGKWSNCNFDWVMKQGNYIKVLEGTYSKNLATKAAKEAESPTKRYGEQLSPPKDFKINLEAM